MSSIHIKSSKEVESVFSNYPISVRNKMQYLRALILESANEIEELEELEEALKWGEPSYLTKKGSTLRIDWKEKHPNQYAMFFNCQTKLISTFRTVFSDVFQFDGNRAIVFPLDKPVAEKELKDCIRTSLIYHKVKHLPLLGL